jgi:hypothetical protein
MAASTSRTNATARAGGRAVGALRRMGPRHSHSDVQMSRRSARSGRHHRGIRWDGCTSSRQQPEIPRKNIAGSKICRGAYRPTHHWSIDTRNLFPRKRKFYAPPFIGFGDQLWAIDFDDCPKIVFVCGETSVASAGPSVRCPASRSSQGGATERGRSARFDNPPPLTHFCAARAPAVDGCPVGA